MPTFKVAWIKNNSISKGGEKMSDQKLDLILNKLQSLENEMKSMKSETILMKDEMKSMNNETMSLKDEMKSMNNELISMNGRIENLETKTDHIQSDVTEIKGNIERIDHAVNEGIVAILKTMGNKTNDNNADIVVLNNRFFKVESKIQQITGQ